MQYVIEVTEDFGRDVIEILSWYSMESEGLDGKFLRHFEQAILSIQKAPFTGKIEVQFRRYLLKKFPYKIYYKVYNNRIRLYGIFHIKRDPEFIHKRLQ